MCAPCRPLQRRNVASECSSSSKVVDLHPQKENRSMRSVRMQPLDSVMWVAVRRPRALGSQPCRDEGARARPRGPAPCSAPRAARLAWPRAAVHRRLSEHGATAANSPRHAGRSAGRRWPLPGLSRIGAHRSPASASPVARDLSGVIVSRSPVRRAPAREHVRCPARERARTNCERSRPGRISGFIAPASPGASRRLRRLGRGQPSHDALAHTASCGSSIKLCRRAVPSYDHGSFIM